MSLPDSLPPSTAQPTPAQRARRRRAQRAFFPSDAEGQDAMLAELSRRAYPSYELYVFSLLCALIVSLGFAFDSQALLIFGALSAPTLTVWVGLNLAALTGPIRFFSQTLAALLVSAFIVFFVGLLAGLLARPFEPVTRNQIYNHSSLWWPDLLVVAIGAILTTVTFVRTQSRPSLQSALLAYGFFLPICAAGFGIGAGLSGVWPQAALVFLVHFVWATLFGIITLLFLRFRPLSIGGFAFSALVMLVIIFLLATYLGITNLLTGLVFGPPPAAAALTEPSPLPSLTETGSLVLSTVEGPTSSETPRPSATPSATPAIESPPPTLLGGNVTFPPTETPLPTITFEPTPIFAKIAAIEGGGAYLRKTPGGQFLATLENGVLVEVLGETEEVSGVTWIHVAAIKNGIRMDGWLLQSVLLVSTPVVNWEPSATPTFTPAQ